MKDGFALSSKKQQTEKLNQFKRNFFLKLALSWTEWDLISNPIASPNPNPNILAKAPNRASLTDLRKREFISETVHENNPQNQFNPQNLLSHWFVQPD